MNISLETMGQIITIFGFCCASFNYIVIKPLRRSMDGLKASVEILSATVDNHHKEQAEIDKRVIKVEQQCEFAHQRIDILAGISRGTK